MSTLTSVDRFWASLQELSACTEAAQPWTRRAFTPEFDAGRACLKRQMLAAGLNVRVDAAGNLVGRRPGSDPSRRTIMLGSHTDTVRSGGRFDGVAGVLAALEVAQALPQEGLSHTLEVVDFLAEEPGAFGLSCIGSRAAVGALDPEALERRDATGRTLAASIEHVGGAPGELSSAVRKDICAFIELHIEQGPVLEDRGIDLGIVSEIVGIERVVATFSGQAAHAGTTPMRLRRDALVAAAEFVQAVESDTAGAPTPDGYYVATVGQLTAEPNSPNVVPGRATLSLDIRSDRSDCLREAVDRLRRRAQAIADRRGVRLERWERVSSSTPVGCDPSLRALLEHVASELGHSHMQMPSGAGHDCAFMARVAPAAMLFVPSRRGLSHCPEEWTDPGQLAIAIETLARFVQQLDALHTNAGCTRGQLA